MNGLRIDVAVPLGNQAGHVAVEITVPDLDYLSDRDRKFVGEVLELLARWTGDLLAAPPPLALALAAPSPPAPRPQPAAAEVVGRFGSGGQPSVLDGVSART